MFEVFQFAYQNNKMASGDNGDDEITVYHYTDNDSLEKIKKSGLIKESKPGSATGDAVFGQGVYVTRLSPEEHSKKDIARNNYDDGEPFQDQKLSEGKVDGYIEVKIPKSDSKLQKETNQNRDVAIPIQR